MEEEQHHNRRRVQIVQEEKKLRKERRVSGIGTGVGWTTEKKKLISSLLHRISGKK